ncbi:spermidine/putrescine ABC transporter substrate-binding protein [Lentisphaera profundi]|uniref:Spermidine/putrescine ABC transporter substrate-binding protein n=1 Tax=Lentisphaera profundi TaxID=1658616 RepID=A0ABY7VZM2_9BACT|nr:spermidine/putrescine ABC transporter substrate-binding protein [Lentisphaera profundi]WDE98708.1 spermidine/putrescine ABC transporter substrate-binding protein [Lentisphaera profundi]
MKRKVSLCFLLIAVFAISCKETVIEKGVLTNSSNELILYNWEEYTPANIIEQFEKETGIKVVIKEFQTVDEQIATLQSEPDFCDLTIVGVTEAKQVFTPLKLIEEIDRNQLTGNHKYNDFFKNSETYGVPYCSGLLGFAVDKRYVDLAFKDFSFLVSDPQYKGKISLLDEPSDIYYLLMNSVGASVNSVNRDDHDRARQFTSKIISMEPHIQDLYSGLDDLNEGKIWMAMAYSGDALMYQEENSNIEFVYPQDRPFIWRDMLCLNINAPNKKNAYRFLDFINTPQVAAEIAVQFKTSPGIIGAEKYMDRETMTNPLVNIPKSLSDTCEVIVRFKENNAIINELYTYLVNGSHKDDNDEYK